MKRLAFFAVVVSWGAILASAQQDRIQVAGTVRSATTREPLSDASVTLMSQQKIARRVTTGPDGSFAISGLPPGLYAVIIGKAGYQSFQAKVPLTIARDSTAVANLEARLWPSGVIGGRVVDSEGEPVPKAEVRAYAVVYEHNGVTVSLKAMRESDDLGQYRLSGLSPGKYLLQVSPPRKENPTGRSYANTPTAYYPGTTAPSQALPIELNWAAEITSADVWILPDPSYTIKGLIWDAEAEGPCTHCVVQVVQDEGVYRVNLPQTARASRDGKFVLHGLASGDYSLVAVRGGSKGEVAHMQVSVRDGHVEDARLTIGVRQPVSGEIVLEDPPQGTVIDVAGWLLRLSPVSPQAGWLREDGEVAADRQFAIPEVTPARYRFELRGLPRGAYLKGLRLGGQLLPSPEIVVSPDAAVSGLQAVVGFNAAALLGKVQSPENATPVQARIFVLPRPGRDGSQLPQTTETNPDGSFSLTSIAPGSYTVYALSATTSVQIFDPAVQAALGRYARQVDLEPKEITNVAVPLAPQLP